LPSHVLRQLNREWQRHTEQDRQTPLRWAALCPPLKGCLDLNAVLECVSTAPDTILGFLIAQGSTGDAIAVRTVLQTMLGKLVLMAGSGTARQQPHALDDLIGHMWLRIISYPLQKRPESIAANLALDTLKAALRDWRTTDSAVEAPALPHLVADALELHQGAPTDAASAGTKALLDAAHHLGLISETTRDVLVAVYGPEELSGQHAAQRWGCTPQAIRSRCSRAVRDMAPHAGLLRAAAA